MTKNFCDLCGEPALKNLESEVKLPYDAPYKENGWTSPDSPKAIKPKIIQAYIVARVHYSFRSHRTGFGGPPDLCEGCVQELLELLLRNHKTPKDSKAK